MKQFCKLAVLLFSLYFVFPSISNASKTVIKYYDAQQTKVSYRGLSILKGQISNITDYMYNLKDYYIAYYLQGRLIKYKYINNGNIAFEDRLVYSKNKIGNIKSYIDGRLSYVTVLYEDELKSKKVNVFDKSYIIYYFRKDKQLKRALQYNRSNELITYTMFAYNTKNKQSKVSYFSSGKKLIKYVLYSYNNNGLRVKKSLYNENKKPLGYTNYSYNSNAILTKAQRFNIQGELLGYVTYQYDESGKLRYKLYYDSKGILIPR